jgi:hypothetical protein
MAAARFGGESETQVMIVDGRCRGKDRNVRILSECQLFLRITGLRQRWLPQPGWETS